MRRVGRHGLLFRLRDGEVRRAGGFVPEAPVPSDRFLRCRGNRTSARNGRPSYRRSRCCGPSRARSSTTRSARPVAPGRGTSGTSPPPRQRGAGSGRCTSARLPTTGRSRPTPSCSFRAATTSLSQSRRRVTSQRRPSETGRSAPSGAPPASATGLTRSVVAGGTGTGSSSASPDAARARIATAPPAPPATRPSARASARFGAIRPRRRSAHGA